MGKEMLQACFLWFYCLPIADAVLLAIAMSGAYLILAAGSCRTFVGMADGDCHGDFN